MPLWFAAVMGLVQGLTEFIPVSSSAHLRIAPALFGQPDAGAAYTAVIQIGTLLAVLIYFAKDLITLPVAAVREPSSPDGKLAWLIVFGTLPIAIAGVLLKKHIETDLRSLYISAATLVGLGIVMWAIDRHATGRSVFKPLASITFADAMIIGLAQTLALVPGVSRSGSTICMALLIGYSRADSARFSFLLSIPAVAGAAILESREAFRVLGADAIPALAVGIGVAAVVGYASIAWFLRWLGTHKLVGFAIYRIVCGLALAGAIAAGYLHA
jgi:undecaprenyl-diphosphatase